MSHADRAILPKKSWGRYQDWTDGYELKVFTRDLVRRPRTSKRPLSLGRCFVVSPVHLLFGGKGNPLSPQYLQFPPLLKGRLIPPIWHNHGYLNAPPTGLLTGNHLAGNCADPNKTWAQPPLLCSRRWPPAAEVKGIWHHHHQHLHAPIGGLRVPMNAGLGGRSLRPRATVLSPKDGLSFQPPG